MISDMTGVTTSTLSYWLREIPYTPNSEVKQRIKNGPFIASRLRTEAKERGIAEARLEAREGLGSVSERDLFMLGIGLYIGEGSKSIESVRITNSNPEVIRLAMKWFRVSLELTDKNFSLILFLYPDTDEKGAIEYWSRVTHLPNVAFKKSQIDVRGGKRRQNYGKLPFGTLQIRVKASGDSKSGVHLFRKIEEWMRIVSA